MNKEMKTHWVADMYPLNESDIEPLAESIKANGQRTPIMALKDGTIIDGRNRWLACQKAGVEPMVTIINPDGEDISEATLWSIATDCNSMRRDMTSSLRACLAAESWKRLWPEGAPTGGAGHKKDKNIRLTFEDFAKQSFKVSETYAKQALAILNYSPDLLEDAKQDLTGTYKTYQGRVAEDRVKRQNIKLLDAPENNDIRDRVANAQLAMEEAIILLRQRHEEEIAKINAEAATRKAQRNKMSDLLGFLYLFGKMPAIEIAKLIIPMEGESTISDPDGQVLNRDSLVKLANVLNEVSNEL